MVKQFSENIKIYHINCEINLILTWAKNCVLTSKVARDVDLDADPAVASINNPTNVTFKRADTNLYVPVVTLSTEEDKKLFIKWNKYRSAMTNQTKNNNLNYLPKSIDYLSYHLKMKTIEHLLQSIM